MPRKIKSKPAWPAAFNGTILEISVEAVFTATSGEFRREYDELVPHQFSAARTKVLSRDKIAFHIVRWHATLVRPEKMDAHWKGRRVAVPNFRAFACSTHEAKMSARCAHRTTRHNTICLRGCGGDFIQPRASGTRSQFVGIGEGKQLNVIHAEFFNALESIRFVYLKENRRKIHFSFLVASCLKNRRKIIESKANILSG